MEPERIDETPLAYSADALSRSRKDAWDWLLGTHGEGFPRTWEQEAALAARRGADHDPSDAPAIAGYEALEREGRVERREVVDAAGEQRVRFVLRTAPELIDEATLEASVAIALKRAKYRRTRGTNDSDEVCREAARAVAEMFTRAGWVVSKSKPYPGHATADGLPSFGGKSSQPKGPRDG